MWVLCFSCIWLMLQPDNSNQDQLGMEADLQARPDSSCKHKPSNR